MMERQALVYVPQTLFYDLVDSFHSHPGEWRLGEGCLEFGAVKVLRLRTPGSIGDGDVGRVGEAVDGGGSIVVCLADQYKVLRVCAAQGYRTVWYNLLMDFAPGKVPIHDGEVTSFEELRDIPALLAKPTLTTCTQWLDTWQVPDNIRRHVSLVAWMAYVLGVLLRRAGVKLDPILAHRGGLLHDLDKLHTLDPSKPHGVLGAAFVRNQGHADLADIISGHVMRADLTDEQLSWENKLVFFCDKLTEQDRIVPFDVRLGALKARYPQFEGVMRRAEPYIWDLNDQICSILSISEHRSLIKLLLDLQKN